MATRPAIRATALLKPDAVPTWSGATDAITVVVSGATQIAKPSPTSNVAGRMSVQ